MYPDDQRLTDSCCWHGPGSAEHNQTAERGPTDPLVYFAEKQESRPVEKQIEPRGDRFRNSREIPLTRGGANDMEGGVHNPVPCGCWIWDPSRVVRNFSWPCVFNMYAPECCLNKSPKNALAADRLDRLGWCIPSDRVWMIKWRSVGGPGTGNRPLADTQLAALLRWFLTSILCKPVVVGTR